MKDPGITPYQFGALISSTILATNILFIPSYVVNRVGEAGWLTLFFAAVLDVTVGALLFYLGRKFPEQNFIQYSLTLAGPLLGSLINLIYLGFLLLAAAMSVRSFGDFITENYLPATPRSFIIYLVVFVAGVGANHGLESIARAGELITPVAVGLLFLIFFLVSPDITLARLRPVTLGAAVPALRASLVPTALFGECVIMAMLMPFVQEQRKTLLAKGTAVAVASLITALLVAASVGVFGAVQTGNFTCALNQLTRIISVAGFLERLEALFMSVWMLTAFLKIALFLWVVAWGLRQWWNLSDYRPLLLPLGFLLAALSEVFASNCPELLTYLSYHPYFALPVEVGITSFLVLLGWVRFRGKGGSAADKLAGGHR
ncbi:MAG: spore germination protein [Firmicutes bacterium]|nr:spore germination protein [Bacillota bacterium]MCL5040394.1 spore germination protein [Bacillota bacterium]